MKNQQSLSNKGKVHREETKDISRRNFLKTVAAGAAFISTGKGLDTSFVSTVEASSHSAPPKGSTSSFSAVGRVVEIQDKLVVASSYDPDVSIVQNIIDRGMRELTGKSSLLEAWQSFVTPGDVVGIKVNVTGGKVIMSNYAVINSIIEGLKSAGVKENNIIVWERHSGRLEKVGLKLNKSSQGVRFYATGDGIGYDPEVYYDTNIPGKPRESDLEYGKEVSTRSHFSRIVTQQITKLITVPVIKDASQAGIAITLKNLSFGTVDNTPRFHPPDILCDPAIPEICANPVLRDKAVLHILDAIHAQYNGGPYGDPKWIWNYNSILFSTDPVALDYLGAKIINEKREKEGMPELAKVGKAARHITTAARMDLGTNDPSKIDHLKIDITEAA
jgi:uncharacterized protein (DUF362 family)